MVVVESKRESQLGICYECSTKDGDSSQKPVYRCDLCRKWFCKEHLKPKFPYFVDWDTVFDVQGNPEIKALFYTEYKREGGHPDFIFLRKTIEASELEEKMRNELIKKAMDRMMQTPLPRKPTRHIAPTINTFTYGRTTRTYGNIHHYSFEVFTEVHSDKEYRERLDKAKSMNEVENIEKEYFSHHPKPKFQEDEYQTQVIGEIKAEEQKEQTKKKKHWWQ